MLLFCIHIGHRPTLLEQYMHCKLQSYKKVNKILLQSNKHSKKVINIVTETNNTLRTIHGAINLVTNG